MPTGRIGFDLEDPTGLGSLVAGLKNVQEGLFPDPSKYASAGYYGAKQRETQMDANLKADTLNSRYRMWQMINGGVPGGDYAPAPFVGQAAPMMWQPGAPSLGGIVSGSQPPALLNPQRSADFVQNNLQQGGQAPPPASPPAPGLPSAPNTTGSDGSVPASDPVVPMHPGSVTSADGGQKMSGPAQHDGSPAPVNLNIPQLMALAVQSGMDAAAAKGFIASYISNLWTTGRIDRNTMSQLNAQLEPGTIYTQDATTARTGMEVAGRQKVAGMEIAGRQQVAETQEAGQTTRKGMEPVTVTQGGQPVTIPTSQLPQGQGPNQPYGGYTPGVETEKQQAQSQAAASAREMVWVQQPDGSFNRKPRGQLAPSDRVVDDKTAETQMAPVNVLNPDGTTKSVPRYVQQAQGLQEAPTTVEQVRATGAAAGVQGGRPLADIITQQTPAEGVNAEESAKQLQARNISLDTYYPPSPELTTRDFAGVRLDGPTQAKVDALAQELKRSDTSVKGDDRAAYAKAIRLYQQGRPDGKLPTSAEYPSIINRFQNSAIVQNGKKYLQIGLTQPGEQTLSSTVSGGSGGYRTDMYGGVRTPAPAAAAPAAPAAGAPAESWMREGTTYTNQRTGEQAIVRGGRLVPLAAPGGGGG